MIEIKITDPTVSDAPLLRGILAALEGDHGNGVVQTQSALLHMQVGSRSARILPEDNPAKGADAHQAVVTGLLDVAAALIEEDNTAPPDFAAARGQSPNVPPVPALYTAGADPILTAPAVPLPTLTGAASVPPVPALPSVPGAPTVAPLVQPGAPVPGVEVDADGLPWDTRIHSSAKSKNADGRWKAKRNVMPQLIAQVQAELRQVMAIPSAAPAPNVPPVPTLTPQPSLPTMPGTGASSITTFAQILPRITAATAAGTLTQEGLLIALQSVGLPNVPMLATRTDLIPQVAAILFPGA